MTEAISSTDVNRVIRRVVWAGLRGEGFEDRTARTAWRRWEEGVDVVNFQSFNASLADGVGSTTFSFGVNLGTFLDYVPELPKFDRARPKEWQCHLRLHLKKGIAQPFFRPYGQVLATVGKPPPKATDRPDVWLVKADGSNVEECVADAWRAIRDEGLPWFLSTRGPEAALEELTGRAGDLLGKGVVRSFVLGFVALRAGRLEVARANLSRANESDAWAAHMRGEIQRGLERANP